MPNKIVYSWDRDRSSIGAVDFRQAQSMTKQEHKAECDINNIMARYLNTGVFPDTVKVGRYGDFSEAPEFRDALHLIREAKEQFAGLPSKVRQRFRNNPEEFLEFVRDPKNLDEAKDLGLLSDEAVAREKAKVVIPEGTVKVETLKT